MDDNSTINPNTNGRETPVIGRIEKIYYKSGFISTGRRSVAGWDNTNPVNPDMNDEIIRTEPVDNQSEETDWVEKAIEREATPKELREGTVEKFAEKYGIDPSTYYRTVRRKENKRKIVEIWLNEALNGGQEVLRALQEKAKKGDTKAIELYMKFVLELAENLDIKSDGQKLIINQMFYGDNNTSSIYSATIPNTVSSSSTESQL
jgi:hypothetical protein